ncbi:hypothetical protein MGN70_001644 [Eutypa lata]|nr:hypothetical protein MGN70_001644 [Eutypa lata]
MQSIGSYVMGVATDSNHSQTTPNARDEKTIGNKQQTIQAVPNAFCLETECFPDILLYEDDRENCSKRFPDPTYTLPVTSSLSQYEMDMLDKWLASESNRMLSIIAEGNNDDLARTTSLTLEMIKTIETATEKLGHRSQPSVVLSHFCGENNQAKHGRRELILVQDLLRQLLGVRKDELSNPAANVREPAMASKLRTTPRNIEDLWGIFKTSINELKISRLVILLDNVEVLYDEGFHHFVFRLHSLIDPLREDNAALIKVLATSRIMSTTSVLEKFGSTIIVIPRPPCQRGGF